MRLTVIFYSSLELFIGLIAAYFGYLSWEKRSKPTGGPLFLLASAIAGWAIVNGLQSLLPQPLPTYVFSFATHPFAAAAAVAAFILAVEYTGQEQFHRRAVSLVLVGWVGLVLTMVVTQPFHGQFTHNNAISIYGTHQWDPGPGFLIHIVGSMGLLIAALLLLLAAYPAAQGVYRKQLQAMLTGGFIAGIFVIIHHLAIIVAPGLSLSVVGLTILVLLFYWALFKADLMKTAPVARATLVESMDDAIIALNADDTVVDLNSRARDLLDVGTDTVGADATVAFGAHPALLDQFVDTFEAEQTVELEVDDTTRHFDVNVSPVVSEVGTPVTEKGVIGRIIVIRDITEKIERQQRLESQKQQLEAQKHQLQAQKQELEAQNRRVEQQKHELERKNEKLDQFAGIISHDLRNPLNTAAGFVDVAKETEDFTYLERVERAHRRMERMVDELLTLSRAETELEPTEEISASKLVDDAWDIADTDGATLENELNPGWQITAKADLLRHVFENLFRNAAEHNDGPLEVRVGQIGNSSAPEGLFVEDTGTGIPPEERMEVFEHGYTTNASGTGFGLSIVHELVAAHGWEITIADGEEGGARFEIRMD